MKRIKEAEHLQFPLQSKERGGVKSSGEVIGSFKAQNHFEDAITSLLKSANLTESAVTKREDEELQGQELSMEEIKARREKLAYQRELMFRAESKAKRISKIKSKTYRKLARKRAAKEGGGDLNLEDLERLDPEAAAHEREKLERDRARERATLRHGAKSGRWARDQTQGGEGEMEDRRRAREEMLDIKEKLQRKIQGKDEGDSSDSDSQSDNEDDDEEVIRDKAFNQLSALDKPVQNNGKKGLMDMAFMKKAQDREMKRVAEDEKQAREDIENYGNNDNSDDESDGDDSDKEAIMEKVGGNEGRMVFAPTKVCPFFILSRLKTRMGADKKPIAQGQAQVQKPTEEPKQVEAPKPQPFKSALSQPTPDQNPWLASTISSAGPSRKKNATLSTDKASRQLAKSAAAREAVMDDERVDIAIDAPVSALAERGQGKKRKVDEEEEEEDGMLPNGLKGFKQRDLVAEAFAGDDVVQVSPSFRVTERKADFQDFAAEKARQTEADAPTTKNTALPGWVCLFPLSSPSLHPSHSSMQASSRPTSSSIHLPSSSG
jgi:U3 small nucleolar RNA-associated protein 14